MTIALISCISSNAAIGVNNELLFNIKEDLQNFKELTKGHIVIQGMRTFESIISRNSKPLSNRVNVVLTSDKDYSSQYGEIVFHNIESILKHHKTMRAESDKKVYIIGGESVYREFLPHADNVYLTVVNKHIDKADSYFPMELLNSLFKEVEKSDKFYSEKYDAFYQFILYERKEVIDVKKEGEE